MLSPTPSIKAAPLLALILQDTSCRLRESLSRRLALGCCPSCILPVLLLHPVSLAASCILAAVCLEAHLSLRALSSAVNLPRTTEELGQRSPTLHKLLKRKLVEIFEIVKKREGNIDCCRVLLLVLKRETGLGYYFLRVLNRVKDTMVLARNPGEIQCLSHSSV